MITVGDSAQAPLQDVTRDWDYATPVTVERVITISKAEAAAELGYGPTEALRLDVIVEAGTGPGDLPREIIVRDRAALDDGSPCTIILRLDPARMSTQLTLRTSIILATGSPPADPLAPRILGARLWDDRISSRIEGDDLRFPMEIFSFSEAFAGRPHAAAPWLLSWSTDSPSRDFHGAARLYVNADESVLVARLKAEDELTLQALMGDVVSQMCEAALVAGWDHDFSSAEPGSVAGRVSHWLERAFSDVAVARALFESRPGEFRSAILASAKL
ncbi:hypothetical protein AXW83_00715 [Bosea sp. PAMC 26642]|nr:hypothetical protein AXW83_00715 [Bosea sp. PAMC 26642]